MKFPVEFTASTVKKDDPTYQLLRRVVEFSVNKMIASAPLLNELDSKVGDGDLGVSVEAAGKEILKIIDNYPFQNPSLAFYELSLTLQEKLGGK